MGNIGFLIVFLGYFSLLSVLNLDWGMGIVGFLLGGLISLGLETIDRLVYVYVVRPTDQLSLRVKDLVRGKRFGEALENLRLRRNEQLHLVTRSALFMFGWIALATYVVTSTGSLLAIGVVMGAGLKLLLQIWGDIKNKTELKRWLFWQVKREIDDKELKIVVGLFMAVFVVLSLWLV